MSRGACPDAAILLGTAADGRVHLAASVAPELVARGVKAGAVVKCAAGVVGGGGGGRDTIAQAGGREPEKLDEALAAGEKAIVSALEANPRRADARARPRLRQRPLRLRAQRSHRDDRHADPGHRPARRPARARSDRSADPRARGQRVVVGLPLSLHGGDSEQTRETREFAARLSARLGEAIPVELHDERFSTRIARGSEPQRAGEDSRAAAHMLESWLHARSRNNPSPASPQALRPHPCPSAIAPPKSANVRAPSGSCDATRGRSAGTDSSALATGACARRRWDCGGTGRGCWRAVLATPSPPPSPSRRRSLCGCWSPRAKPAGRSPRALARPV